MNIAWMIPTQNDPLGTVRKLLENIWSAANLKRVLLPLNGTHKATGPRIIKQASEIRNFNPFTPLMPINAAQMIPELINGQDPAAAVLRPCEIRTLNGMLKFHQLQIDNLLTISVDCLGTLPADEFEWRAQRIGSPKSLAHEALQFARQGGIVPYRYRAACQICESPAAHLADINIGVLGLPVRQYIIVKVRDSNLAAKLQELDSQPIDPDLLAQHQKVSARLAERGTNTRERIFSGLAGLLPSDLDTLVEPLHGCDDCKACLEACPICTSDFPRLDDQGEYIRDDVMEWLVSCSGCGICEQSCPKHLPLTIIFGHIQKHLAEL